jgi:sugar phosphate isomerase/epimerase
VSDLTGTLAIEPITADDAAPPELVRIAAQLQVPAIGVVVQPRAGRPDWQLVGDTPMRRATAAACREHGVRIDALESFLLESQADIPAFAPALEAGAWLGARTLTLLVRDEDRTRLVDRIRAFLELAGGYGLQALLEFTPRMSVRTFAEAAQLAREVGDARLGIVVDALHMARTGAWAETLPLLASPLVRRVQLSDGPLLLPPEQGLHEAMADRQLPGQGELPLRELLASLPPGIPVGIEVPQERARLQGVPALERVRRAVDATRRLFTPAPAAP